MKQMMKMAVKGFLTKMLLAAAVITVCAYEVYSEELYLPNDGPATTSTIRSIKRLSSSNIAASSFPFSPVPSDILFVTDKNSDNKGQLGEYLGKGTITIPLEINRYFGNKTTLIGHDALPKKVVLEFVTYDIDEDAANPELDYIFFNGKKIGQLHGSDSNYHWMSYLVDIEDVELPKEIGDVGKNTITIQVDVNSGGWKTSIEWISLYIPAPPPVVIAHGINDSAAKNVSLTNAIGSLGLPVHIFDFDNNGFNSIRDGARQLATEVQNAKSRFHVDHVNIVAHSMGGLKAREYTETAHDVLKVLQIATPNAGSPVVDNALRLDIARIANGIISARPAIPDLSVAHMAMYNGDQRHRLNPDVYYRVVAGVVTNGFHNRSNLLYAIGSPYYGASNGIEGDGIVPLWSAHSFVRHYDSSPIRGVENEASHTALVVDNVNYVVNTFLKEDLLSPKQLAATSSSAGMSAPDPSTATLDDAVARLTSSIDLGMIKVGETAVYPFEVVKGNKTSVCVEIGDCEDFDLYLTSPSGKSYGSSTGNVSIKIEGGTAIISLSSPETGTWTASIKPKVSLSGASEVVYLILVDEVDTGIEIDSTLTSDSVHAGEPFTVRVRPTIDGRMISGTVKASITHSGAASADDVTTVILSPDGNGVFTGQLPTTTAGQYDIAVSVAATSPVAFKRGTLLTGVATDSATAFTGSVSFAGEDTDGNGLYNSLVALVGVNVTKDGTYRLYATLSDVDSNEGIQETWTTNVYCYAGVQNMRIDFSGTKIYAHGQCSGYKLSNARLMEIGDNYDAIVDTITDVAATSDYLFSQFEHATLRIGVGGNDEAVDTDGDNLHDSISVTLPLVAEVSAAETYRWSATLADVDGQILSRSYGTVTIEADSDVGNMMKMVFPMKEVIERQIEGSFVVSNILLWNQASGRYIVLDGTYHTAHYPLSKWSFAASDGTSAEAVVVTWKGNADAATYQVWRGEDVNIENAVQIGTSEGVSYSDTTANPGKTYYYWVRPIVVSQAGEFIGPDSGFRKMPAPTGVTASTAYTNYVEVAWNAVEYAQEYHVYRSETASSADAVRVYMTPRTTFMDTTAIVGKRYYYWVKAVGEGKSSEFSGYGTGYRKPSAVTGVSASDGTYKGGVAITWEAESGAIQYKIYRSTTAYPSQASLIDTVARRAYFDISADAAKPYYYWIKAAFADAESEFSAADSGWRRATISGDARFLVIDLSQGSTVERFPCYEMWSMPSGGWTREYKTDKLVLRRIEAGSFDMGSPSSETGRSTEYWRQDASRHRVTFTKPFYIGVFELTRKQWNLIGNDNGYDPTLGNGSDACPVYNVSYWNVRGDLSKGSVEWPSSSWVQPWTTIQRLRDRTGFSGFDLPTEAQWEYACRAGTSTAINNGTGLSSATALTDANMTRVARYKDANGDCGPTEVGSFEPNYWGLYDMHGNVAEWCLDWYNEIGTSDVTDPVGPSGGLGECKVLRGGGHADSAANCRSASRHGVVRKEEDNNNGVRLAIHGEITDNMPDDPVFLIDDGELIACEPNQATKITVPSTVKRISSNAFRNCNTITEIVIPNSVTDIEGLAISYCDNLTKVTIGSGVVRMGDRVFDGCCRLNNIIVDATNVSYKSVNGMLLTKDGTTLVQGINGDVTIPNSVTSIESSAFSYCRWLTHITIPDSVTSIGWAAFEGCSGLTSVTIPNGVTNIGSYAFSYCSGLTHITIPDGVTNIKSSAFSYCSRLSSVTIPNSVTRIERDAFRSCDDMLYDTTTIAGVILVDGWAIGNDGSLSGDLDLTDARGVGEYAFCNCSNVTSVTVGTGVKGIGYYAFDKCYGLKAVYISDIASWCQINFGDYFTPLWYATKLYLNGVLVENLTIPDGVTHIGDYAFVWCSGLTSVTVPDSVKNIGNYAFSNCHSLQSLRMPNDVNVGYGVFSGCYKLRDNCGFVIVNNRLFEYAGYSDGEVVIPHGVTTIEGGAFDEFAEETKVVIPDSVTNIADYAFSGVDNLADITIPDSVMHIGMEAFYDCEELTNVVIGSGVTEIGQEAFAFCSSLCDVMFKESMSNSLTNIEDGAFSYAYSLTAIKIPNRVERIGASAFDSCENLEKVVIGSGVTDIGDEAFAFCSSLVDVKFMGNAPTLGEYVFDEVDPNCIVKVLRGSTGWGVDIPGTWHGMPIDYFMTHTVSFSANDGVGTMLPQTFIDGELDSLRPNAFVRDSYKFVGWATRPGGEVRYKDGQRIMVSSDIILYAVWELAFTIEDGVLTAVDPDLVADNVVIPNGVTEIDFGVFQWMSLASVTIPATVTRIGAEAFAYCENLEKVTFLGDADAIDISATAFIYTPWFSSNHVMKEYFTEDMNGYTWKYHVVDGGAVIGYDEADYYYVVCEGDDESPVSPMPCGRLVLPETLGGMPVVGIGLGAFEFCDEMTAVVLPTSLKTIGPGAFWMCESLTAVAFPAGVMSIGEFAFSACSTLETLIFNGNAPDVGACAFLFDAYEEELQLSCIVRVHRGSTGWNVDIPGMWNDMPIDYIEQPFAVTFDANGGKPAKQSLPQIATTAWNVSELQVPTMSGCAFDGWWTAKTGGERVDLDDVCNFSVDTTLYARWLKAYKLTVKGGVAYTDKVGPADSINVVNGTITHAEAADMSAKNMVFSHWTYTPATVDLGDGFNPNLSQVDCVMPEAALTLIANYVTSPGYARIHVQEVNNTANADGEPEGIEWSCDGKFWRVIDGATAFPVNSGKSVSLQFRATDPRWTVPAKASYVVQEGACVDIAVPATRVTIVRADVVGGQPGAANTVTMTPKNGQVLDGKPVALTAKPGKDAVFAYWLANGEAVCYDASFKYAPEVDSTVTAVFRSKSEVQNPVLDADAVVLPANAMVGVAFKAVVPVDAAAYPAKFTASKLPPGLKIDGASGQIVGVPSKAGKYSVEITATGGPTGKGKSSITIPISIAELPAWAVGNFEGFVNEGPTSDICADTEVGPATMSVTATGKVSGKCTLMGTNWTFKADSYSIRSELSDTLTNFVVEAVVTAGKVSRILSLDLQAFPSGVASAVSSVGGGFYESGSATPIARCVMIRVPWSDKGDAKAMGTITAYAGAYTYEANYGATVCPVMFTLDEKGVIKGTVEVPEGTKTRKVTFTSKALPYLDGLMTFLAVSSDPKKGYLSIFDAKDIVNHHGEPAVNFAYRDPGVVAAVAERTPGSGASGTVTVSPKYGQVAAGKVVTLTAKADKNSVFGHWELEGINTNGLDLMSATLKFKSPGTNDVFATAKFVTVDEDKASITLAVNGEEMRLAGDGSPQQTNVWAGVYLEWPVAASALSETKVKVAGLPSGLKFTDKPVTSKIGTGKTAVTVTNVLANTIYGAPTAASKTKVDRDTGAVTVTPSKVVFTVTTAGKSTQTYQIDTVVDPLPAWAVGTFAGCLMSYPSGLAATSPVSGEELCGTVALTIDAKGKISGKALGDGLTYTLAAPYYTGFELAEGVSNFLADVTASWSYKDGTKTVKTNDTVQLVVQDNGVGGVAMGGPSSVSAEGADATERVPPSWTAWQYNWKVEPWKTLGKSFDKKTLTYAILADGTFSDDEAATVALGADVTARVTLKFAASGTVSVAGEFAMYDETKDRYTTVKASGSATLVPVDDGHGEVFIYLTPKGLDPHARCLNIAWSKE